MSDTNRVQVGIIKETTFDTTPTSPAFQTLRITGTPNLGYNPNTVVSNEIRSDRRITDLILVGESVSGDLGFELSFANLDDVIEGAMMSTWSNKSTETDVGAIDGTGETVTVSDGTDYADNELVYITGCTESGNNGLFKITNIATNDLTLDGDLTTEADPPATSRIRVVEFEGDSGDITATAGATNYLASTTLDFTTLPLAAGDWIKIGGSADGDKFGTAANNGWARISVVAANQLTLDRVPTGWTTDAGASKTVQIFIGDKITDSTTKNSYSIERQFQDHGAAGATTNYEVFAGCAFNQLTINAASQSILTANASIMGSESSISDTRTSGATSVDAPTNDVLNTSSNVGRIGRNGSPVASPSYILDASISINNNVRMHAAVGQLNYFGFGLGECNVSGTLRTYFNDKDELEDLVNNTEISFDMVVGRDNKYTLFDIPAMKYASGVPDVPGKNQDVLVDFGFQAIMDSTLGYTMKVQRFHYVP